MSRKNFLLNSTQPSARRSNIPLLPRVANNGTDGVPTTPANTSARPPSAGEALRRISYTRKLNRSNSEKINAHAAPSSGSQQSSLVSRRDSIDAHLFSISSLATLSK